ncbi:unnamed protein product [Cylindrotheca closterium]|uniref:Uncharacterized protein n=1 Tax=Cylindrotheca closterium TaxID=2856 RepID=A0AAD2FPC1_9STRA|nr:unnamed protein product [Cylindrotheca closterium]
MTSYTGYSNLETKPGQTSNKANELLGFLRESNLLSGFEKIASKHLFQNCISAHQQLKKETINSQTCPSKLPPIVSKEGLMNFVQSHLNDTLDPEFQNDNGNEDASLASLPSSLGIEEEDRSIVSNAQVNDGSFVFDVDYGSNYGTSYLPNNIAMPDAAATNIVAEPPTLTEDLIDSQKKHTWQAYSPKILDPTVADHDKAYFQERSHYILVNAFHDICFGANMCNIHLATPGETLHMHQKGAMVRVVESL